MFGAKEEGEEILKAKNKYELLFEQLISIKIKGEIKEKKFFI